MSDHIILCRFIFIFLKELCRTGKSNLCDILFHLVCSHTETVIDELHRLLFRVDNNFNLRLVSLRELILAHHVQLLELRDRIASVRDHLTDKDVVIRIYPFLYNRKYIFTVN